jgi:hypothetical protein
MKAGNDLFKNLYRSYFTGGPLGVFTEPLLNFVATYNTLRKNNPELKEQPAAATAYFSMLAETPTPTTGATAQISKSILNETEDIDPYQMLGKDGYFIVYGDGVHKLVSRDSLQAMPAADAYFIMVARLQKFLAKMGLTEGIQKTLNEQSRQAQKAQAQAQASQAAAAYAAAMAKKAAEEVKISREDAAEAIAQANKDFEEAVKQEAAEKKKLQNIAAGLPADFDENAGLKKILVIGGIAIVGILLLRKEGK